MISDKDNEEENGAFAVLDDDQLGSPELDTTTAPPASQEPWSVIVQPSQDIGGLPPGSSVDDATDDVTADEQLIERFF